MKRARSVEKKEIRRAAILAAARKIVDRSGFPALTVDAVTKACGLAKGTFYVYFKTREDVVLEVLKDDFESWFVELERYLKTSREPFGPELEAFWRKGVQDRPRLISGLGYLHSALEPELGEVLGRGFKVFLLERIKAFHYLIIQLFHPYVSIEELSHFMLILTGTSVGLWMQSASAHSISMKKVFKKNPALRLFRGDFELHFKWAALALIESPQFRSLRRLARRSES